MSVSSMSHLVDADVTAAAGGDRDAFARLVAATSGVVCAIGLAILRDVAESQDVAQDVFVSVWRDLDKLRNPSSFLPWLRQLTRNRAHHVLRTTRRRERRIALPGSNNPSATGAIDDDRADAMLAAAVDASPSALDNLIAAEERDALNAVLSELPHAAREVVILYYREGGSVKQVAELLGLSEAAVKQRLARARTRVRDALLVRGGETLRASAPGAAFVAMIVAAVGVSAAPTTAAAAGIGAAAGGASSSLKPLLHKARSLGGAGVGAAGTAALAGLFGGLTSAFGGGRRLLRLARTDEERRGIRRMTTVMAGAVTQFSVAVLFWPRNGIVVTAAFVVFAAALGIAQLFWIPRITASRRMAEVRDGKSTIAEQARRRRRSVAWFFAALVLAGAPIIAAWFLRW